ncbi:MAG: hypothetical protein QOH60_3608 [Mycobacterium sp.]|jgi:hypothetical protein|nr:hypothetical protein [Mycobacterium sp.]
MRGKALGACLLASTLVFASGCAGGGRPDTPASPSPPPPPPVAGELGRGNQTAGSVDLVVELEGDDLHRPTDLKFDPQSPRLWIVNQEGVQKHGSWTIIEDVEGVAPSVKRYVDDSPHFLHQPSSLSFHGDEKVVGTCQESHDDIQGGSRWMGPTAWTTDSRFSGGHMSHFDMLHESGYCMGIAWTADHVWWAFNGDRGSLDRNNFNGWHPDAPNGDGLGGHNHHDGNIYRYADGELKRSPGVPSGMSHDAATHTLYVADTGNGRVVKIDTTPPQKGPRIQGIWDEVPLYRVDGVDLAEVIPPGQLKQPSGLEFYKGHLYVADYATGIIYAFTPEGEVVNQLDTGLGAGHVTSLTMSESGHLHFLDTTGNRLYRIDPK